jgi:hypothetical protein
VSWRDEPTQVLQDIGLDRICAESRLILLYAEASAANPPDIHDGVLICLLASNDHSGETTCLVVRFHG